MKKLFFGFIVLMLSFSGIEQVTAQKIPILEFFYSTTCAHCHDEIKWFSELEKKFPDLEIRKYEITENRSNAAYLEKRLLEVGMEFPGVPINFIENETIVGFDNAEKTGENIIETIDQHFYNRGEVANSSFIKKIPLLGEVDFSTWKWATIAATLGFIDGFNPCAMWVLIALLAILINMEDRSKMIFVGSVFILSSFVIYGIALVAWLKVFEFIKFIEPIQWVLGILAMGAGGYSIRAALKNPSGACQVTSNNGKKNIMDRMNRFLHEPSFWVSLGGMVALAFSVNLIELVCSAGIPAIFTGLLAISDVSVLEKWIAILIYLVFYMLDDMIVFALAVWSMKLKILSGKGHFYLQLFGGVLITILGIWQIYKVIG
jgi:thiol-disulfide isomerase/thioredoxin